MGIVIQLLSLREKKSARERERRINTKKKKKERNITPLEASCRNQALLFGTAASRREKNTQWSIYEEYSIRDGEKKGLYWDQWPGGLYEFSLWSLITEKLRQM